MPGLAFDGNCYLAVWQDDRDYPGRLYCARLSPDGVLLDSMGIEVCRDAGIERPIDVAAGDSGFLVVWHHERSDPSRSDVFCARVSPSGQVLDPDGFVVNDNRNYWSCYARVCFDGTNWIVGWRAYANAGGEPPAGAYYARVSQSGVLLDSTSFLLASGDTGIADVESNRANTLIVWYGRDYRNMGTRIDTAGRVIDTVPFRITFPEWRAYNPRIATDGTDYLVAWIDQRQEANTFCARVSSAGRLQDSLGIAVSRHGRAASGMHAGFDGHSYVAVWADSRNPSPYCDIYCARVTPQGEVLDPDGIAIATGEDGDYSPATASSGGQSLVVWNHGGWYGVEYIAGARLDSAGRVLSSGYLVSGTNGWQEGPSVASNGADYLAVWTEHLDGYDTVHVCGARVDGSGRVLDHRPIVVCSVSGRKAYPRSAGGTRCYLAAWGDCRDTSKAEVYGARILPDGTLLDPDGIRLSTGSHWANCPDVCFTDSMFTAVWYEGYSVIGRHVMQSGALLDTFLLDARSSSFDALYPAAGYNGRHCLVAWLRWGTGDSAIWAARVTNEGLVLDPPFRIGPVDERYWVRPKVASDGDGWFVVWDPGYWSGPLGVRVDSSGCPVDTTPIVLTHLIGGIYPDLCHDGSDYVVIWQESDELSYDLIGARVSAAGVVSDTFLVSDQYGSQRVPSLVHGSGDQLMVAYAGFTKTVNRGPANSIRVWANLTPFVGMWKGGTEPLQARPGVSMVRGILRLTGREPARLLDIAGRRVMSLQPGDNDVRHVAPGIYFVRSADSGSRSAVRKVVIQR